MGKIFLRGLIAVAPVAITLALIVWIFSFFEEVLRTPIEAVIGTKYYFPGLGILVALILIFIVGTVINNWVIQKLYKFADKLVRKIPLIKTLYNSVQDLMGFLGSSKKEKLGYVVTLKVQGLRVIGFVTRESFDDLPQGLAASGDVAVYVPFSYQIGGHTLIVPRSHVEKIDMNVEQAMRFAITAGILKNHEK